MKTIKHYSGEKINNWTLIEYSNESKKWKARCVCGVEKEVYVCNLTSGDSMSCGCLNLKAKHNMTGSPEYCSWYNMKDRCLNKNSTGYSSYGGRGIKICERWMLFENFFADMGERPEGTSLGRIDNDGDYCKENCRWETPTQQIRNRRNTIRVFGEDVTSLSEKVDVSRQTICYRIKSGWSEEDLLEPTKKRHDLKSISEKCGVSEHVLSIRLSRGWSMERAMTQPVRQSR